MEILLDSVMLGMRQVRLILQQIRYCQHMKLHLHDICKVAIEVLSALIWHNN